MNYNHVPSLTPSSYQFSAPLNNPSHFDSSRSMSNKESTGSAAQAYTNLKQLHSKVENALRMTSHLTSGEEALLTAQGSINPTTNIYSSSLPNFLDNAKRTVSISSSAVQELQPTADTPTTNESSLRSPLVEFLFPRASSRGTSEPLYHNPFSNAATTAVSETFKGENKDSNNYRPQPSSTANFTATRAYETDSQSNFTIPSNMGTFKRDEEYRNPSMRTPSAFLSPSPAHTPSGLPVTSNSLKPSASHPFLLTTPISSFSSPIPNISALNTTSVHQPNPINHQAAYDRSKLDQILAGARQNYSAPPDIVHQQAAFHSMTPQLTLAESLIQPVMTQTQLVDSLLSSQYGSKATNRFHYGHSDALPAATIAQSITILSPKGNLGPNNVNHVPGVLRSPNDALTSQTVMRVDQILARSPVKSRHVQSITEEVQDTITSERVNDLLAKIEIEQKKQKRVQRNEEPAHRKITEQVDSYETLPKRQKADEYESRQRLDTNSSKKNEASGTRKHSGGKIKKARKTEDFYCGTIQNDIESCVQTIVLDQEQSIYEKGHTQDNEFYCGQLENDVDDSIISSTNNVGSQTLNYPKRKSHTRPLGESREHLKTESDEDHEVHGTPLLEEAKPLMSQVSDLQTTGRRTSQNSSGNTVVIAGKLNNSKKDHNGLQREPVKVGREKSSGGSAAKRRSKSRERVGNAEFVVKSSNTRPVPKTLAPKEITVKKEQEVYRKTEQTQEDESDSSESSLEREVRRNSKKQDELETEPKHCPHCCPNRASKRESQLSIKAREGGVRKTETVNSRRQVSRNGL